MHERVDGGISNVIHTQPVCDYQVHDEREVVRDGQQLDVCRHLPASEEADHGNELGEGQQIQVLARDLVLAQVAVHENRDGCDEEPDLHDYEQRVHGAVLLSHNARVAHLVEHDICVEERRIPYGQNR